MANNKTTYSEVARAKISEKRSIVVSECSKGGYTVAQQIELEENGEKMNVYMKGAFHVDSVEGLLNIRDVVNAAIDIIHGNKPGSKDDESWE